MRTTSDKKKKNIEDTTDKLNCIFFDGGACFNDKEFPEGTPTEISENYCNNKCKYKNEV